MSHTRISWHYDGDERVCFNPPGDPGYVIVKRRTCPICAGKCVQVAHDVKQTIIFAKEDRARAELYKQAHPAKAWTELPEMSDGLRLRGENPWEPNDFVTKADAVCHRCRTRLGTLTIRHDTVFRLREDRLILSGQCGIVIGMERR